VARYGDDVYSKRWGRWANVLVRFREWVATNDADFPFVVDLPSSLESATAPVKPATSEQTRAWEPKKQTQYWEDNWPECPLEVLELRSVIANLGE
jgi:hypothetical protein